MGRDSTAPRICSTVSRTRPAQLATTSPSAVRVDPLGARLSRRRDMERSRAAICLLAPGWLTPSSRAASVMLPCLPTATSSREWLRSVARATSP